MGLWHPSFPHVGDAWVFVIIASLYIHSPARYPHFRFALIQASKAEAKLAKDLQAGTKKGGNADEVKSRLAPEAQRLDNQFYAEYRADSESQMRQCMSDTMWAYTGVCVGVCARVCACVCERMGVGAGTCVYVRVVCAFWGQGDRVHN